VFDGVGLRIFTSVRIILIKNELRQIITGLDKPIDIYDLKAYTVYSIYTKLI
jgi:hypothetical protein